MKQIPQNTIPKQNNYSTMFGDMVESFNLDLTDNFGAFRTSRMKEVTNSSDETDLEIPVGFSYLNNTFFLITDDFVYRGGAETNDAFVKQDASLGNSVPTGLVESLSDVENFNETLYVTESTDLLKRVSNSDWSTISSALTASRPHLLKSFANRLYITDDYTKVYSLSMGDALSTSGSNTLDLGISSDWTITMLQAAENALWIGLLNTNTGRGLIYEWDGSTENSPTRKIELEAGVAAGIILNDTPFILDVRGRLLQYNGAVFKEIDRLNLKKDIYLDNANSRTNVRFIHPNGMAVTDYGSILFNISNAQESQLGFEDTCPAGVYEWHPETGLYHKYAYSTSPVSGTTKPDYGASRIAGPGAIYFRRSTTPTSNGNGTILAGANIYTDATTTRYGVFTNDTIRTTQSFGYFVTGWMNSDNIEDTWSQVYVMYKKLLSQGDKIVVKYRTIEKNSLSSTCTWLNTNTFTTTEDVSDFQKGEIVTILTGEGAGQIMEIDNITSSATVYTVAVKENTLSATGSFVGKFENFKHAGEATFDDKKEWKELNPKIQNKAPRFQLKIGLLFTGENELHRVRAVNKGNINN